MESLRAGRTRYLVVVSRPASKKAQQQQSQQQSNIRLCTSPNRNSNNSNNNNNNQAPSTSSPVITAAKIASSQLTNIDESGGQVNQETREEKEKEETVKDDDENNCSISTSFQSTSGVLHSSVNINTPMTPTSASCDNNSTCNLAQHLCSPNNLIDDFQQQQCDNESTIGSSCSSKSSSNEIEESCLLGIDCNEKTTVGLVLRVLADTAIRLDGDG